MITLLVKHGVTTLDSGAPCCGSLLGDSLRRGRKVGLEFRSKVRGRALGRAGQNMDSPSSGGRVPHVCERDGIRGLSGGE